LNYHNVIYVNVGLEIFDSKTFGILSTGCGIFASLWVAI